MKGKSEDSAEEQYITPGGERATSIQSWKTPGDMISRTVDDRLSQSIMQMVGGKPIYDGSKTASPCPSLQVTHPARYPLP